MNFHVSQELKEFNLLYKEIDDLYHDIALKLGISDSAFNILYTICTIGDGCLQKDICNATFISKQTVNSSIKKLEQSGFLTLKSGKGRDMHIHLTPSGQELAEKKILPVIEMENQSFAEMPQPERKLLLELTKQHVVHLRKRTEQLLEQEEDE